MDDFETRRPQSAGRRTLRQPGVLVRRLAVIFLCALLLIPVAAYRSGTGFDVVRRYLHYGSPNRYDGAPLYAYEKSSHSRFAALGDTLAALSENRLSLLSSGGGELWSMSLHMDAPALSKGGNRAVAWDVGGSQIYVLDAAGLAWSLETEEPLLCARLNRNGWLAVVTGKRNYKGLVRVYDASGDIVFDFNSARRFVSDACVSDDNSRVAVAALGQEDSVFVTDVLLFRLNQKEPEAEYRLENALGTELVQRGSYLVSAADTCLVWAKPDGEIKARYDYDGTYLREYDLGGEGFAAALLNRYQSGSVGRLVTVDSNGEEIGALEIREEVLDLSAAGRYLAVLYTDRLVVYNPSLQVYATLTGTDGLGGVLMRSDGSVLLLGPSSATLFLP